MDHAALSQTWQIKCLRKHAQRYRRSLQRGVHVWICRLLFQLTRSLVADLSVALELDGSSDSPASLEVALAVFYVR